MEEEWKVNIIKNDRVATEVLVSVDQANLIWNMIREMNVKKVLR